MANSSGPPWDATQDNATTGTWLLAATDEVQTTYVGLPPPYLVSNPGMAIPYVIIVTIALAVGVVGNVFIIGAYCNNKKIRTVGNEFLLNLALADLCVTGVADPMCILGVTHGPHFFNTVPHLCTLIASMCLSACFCAFFSLSMLTLSRYICICHNQIYHSLFTRKKAIGGCLLLWVMAFLCEMPNFLGWGGHFFDYKNMQCIWDRTSDFTYTLFVGVVLIATPLVLMTLAYLMIFLKIRESKRKVFAHALDAKKGGLKKEWSETVRAAKSVFVVVMVFLVCWTPYTVVIVVDRNNEFPIWVHLWTTLLAHAHSSVNVFIYGITNHHFRDGYRQVLQRIFCSSGEYDESTTSASTSGTGSKNTGVTWTGKAVHDNLTCGNVESGVPTPVS